MVPIMIGPAICGMTSEGFILKPQGRMLGLLKSHTNPASALFVAVAYHGEQACQDRVAADTHGAGRHRVLACASHSGDGSKGPVAARFKLISPILHPPARTGWQSLHSRRLARSKPEVSLVRR